MALVNPLRRTQLMAGSIPRKTLIGMEKIHFDGTHFRRDFAAKALKVKNAHSGR
jgi:hypothetical protein